MPPPAKSGGASGRKPGASRKVAPKVIRKKPRANSKGHATGSKPPPSSKDDKSKVHTQSKSGKKRKKKEKSTNPCVIWMKKKWDAWDEIKVDEESLKKDPWSAWRAYYCNRSTAILRKLNGSFFQLSLSFCIGQNSIPTFIHLCHTQGGWAFILMCLLLYLGIAYPFYIMETFMGQYSAKKPLDSFRFMCPFLAGVGPIIYLRTLILYFYYLAIFYYSIDLFYDLFFCQTNGSNMLIRLYNFEIKYSNKSTPISVIDFWKAETYGLSFSLYHLLLIVFFILLVGVLRLKLAYAGYGFGILIKTIYFLSVCIMIFGMLRIFGVHRETLSYYPLKRVFMTFDGLKLLSGTAWVEALIFVLSSMGFGTIVHPFLASKSFFHYRTQRDGAYLILLNLLWIIIGAIGLLIWMGYSIVSQDEMDKTLKLLNSPFGFFYVLPFKFAEACLTNKLEIDVLFHVGMIYAIISILGFMTLEITLLALINCSYPENTNVILKLFIFILYVFIVTPLMLLLLIMPKGVIMISYIDYYVNRHFGMLFTCAVMFIAVGSGHQLPKMQYDIRNMLHLKIFIPKRLSAHQPKLAFITGIIFIIVVLAIVALKSITPQIGAFHLKKIDQFIGIGVMFLPLVIIFAIGLCMCCAHCRKSKRSVCQPHKDWFKNFYHEYKCFD